MTKTKPDIRFKFKRLFCECLVGRIGGILLDSDGDTDDDKLLKATLFQISERLRGRMVKSKHDYIISMPAAQAIALRLLYISYGSSNPWFANELRRVSDEVHKHYQ